MVGQTLTGGSRGSRTARSNWQMQGSCGTRSSKKSSSGNEAAAGNWVRLC